MQVLCGGTPIGTVNFEDASTILDTASLSNGTAALSTSRLAVGTHSIKVISGGDTDFNTSTSATHQTWLAWVFLPGHSGEP